MRNGICTPLTANLLLTAVLFFLGCGREEQLPDSAAAEEQQEENRNAALEKSLDLCRDLKWFLERAPAEERTGDEDYEICRKRCLEGLEEYSRKACENIYGNGDGFFTDRVLHVYVLSEMLRRDCLWIGYQGEQPLDRFWETCRKEAIKSGRMYDSEHPKAYMFKLVLSLRPGYGVTQRDLESLIVTALKQGIWKVAILPPFTLEEEKRFLQEPEDMESE